MKSIIKQLGIKNLSLLTVLTTASFLVVALCTSPIFEALGEDCSYFMLLGRLVTEGGVLYVDLFDHKGPLLFFLNAIPQLFIDGALGVWILEVIFMLISMVIMFKIGYIVLKNKSAIFVPLTYLLAMNSTIAGGNLSEEYSNLFCLIGLYIYVKFVESGFKDLSNASVTILGVLLALVVFIRVNNTIVLLSVIACIGVYYIIKDYKRIPVLILFGLLGMLIVTVPMFLYFHSISALDDMLNAAFVHNFNYSNNSGLSQLFNNIVQINGSVFGFFVYGVTLIGVSFGAYALIKKDYAYGFLNLLISIFSVYAMCLSGNRFLHYLVIAIPVIPLSAMIFLKHSNDFIKNLVEKFHLVLLILFVIGTVGTMGITYIVAQPDLKDHAVIDLYEEDALEMSAMIPENERDSVFGYNVEAKWFVITDITPSGKYFSLQEFMAKTNPSIIDEVNEMFETDTPTWLIITDAHLVENQFVLDKIDSDYELVHDNSIGQMYKLIS